MDTITEEEKKSRRSLIIKHKTDYRDTGVIRRDHFYASMGPVEEARLMQKAKPYGGQDDFHVHTLKKGTVIVAVSFEDGTPNSSGFYTTLDDVASIADAKGEVSANKLYQALQISGVNSKGEYYEAPKGILNFYVLQKDTVVAKSKTEANAQFNSANQKSMVQYYVQEPQNKNVVPVASLKLSDRVMPSYNMQDVLDPKRYQQHKTTHVAVQQQGMSIMTTAVQNMVGIPNQARQNIQFNQRKDSDPFAAASKKQPLQQANHQSWNNQPISSNPMSSKPMVQTNNEFQPQFSKYQMGSAAKPKLQPKHTPAILASKAESHKVRQEYMQSQQSVSTTSQPQSNSAPVKKPNAFDNQKAKLNEQRKNQERKRQQNIRRQQEQARRQREQARQQREQREKARLLQKKLRDENIRKEEKARADRQRQAEQRRQQERYKNQMRRLSQLQKPKG